MHAGELIVLAARPAMGKTALALNIAQHVADDMPDKPGKPVALFSLEMSQESLLTRMLCAAARVDSHRFRGGFLNQEERRQLSAALGQLVNSRLFIDDSADTTVMDISAKCRRLKSEHGLSLVIVDYLQLLSSRGKVENRTQEISAFSRGLKLLAKDLEVPIMALSQLSRAPETRPGRSPADAQRPARERLDRAGRRRRGISVPRRGLQARPRRSARHGGTDPLQAAQRPHRAKSSWRSSTSSPSSRTSPMTSASAPEDDDIPINDGAAAVLGFRECNCEPRA